MEIDCILYEGCNGYREKYIIIIYEYKYSCRCLGSIMLTVTLFLCVGLLSCPYITLHHPQSIQIPASFKHLPPSVPVCHIY